jgi:hypothetical protein
MVAAKLGDIVDGLIGAGAIAFTLVTPILRPRRLRWGATDEETRRILPGDELVPTPRWQYTHAVTIHAPPEQVWPWLAQIGYGRGGLYSYQGLENLIGCDIRNADRILPEFQTLRVGDSIQIDSRIPPLPIALLEPGRVLVLHGVPSAENPVNTSWGFYLDALDARHTRLITRSRSDYPLTPAMRFWWGPLVIEPIGFVMERKMLLGIKQRAETVIPAAD